MKKSVFGLGMLGFSLVVLTGCYERRVYVQGPPVAVYEPAGVVVTAAPPAPRPEVIVAAPGPAYVWCPGYWSWQGRWVWVSGAWAVRPHTGARWVPGYWTHRGHGYVYFSGHWR